MQKNDIVSFVKETEYDSTPEETQSTFTIIPVGTIAKVLSVGADGWPEVELGGEFNFDTTIVEPDTVIK